MNRFAIGLAALLCLAPLSTPQPARPTKAPSQAAPDDISLQVTGDVTTILVDRWVKVQDEVQVVKSLPFEVKLDPIANALYFWSFPAGVSAVDRGERLQVTAAPQGNLSVGVKVISVVLDKDGRFLGYRNQFGQTTFSVGAPKPPAPPDPPDPPEPPPDPEPKPDGTSPFAEAGFRVLISFDQALTTRLPTELSVLYGKAVRDYMNAKCVPGPGGMKEWRIYPDHTDVTNAPKVFKDAWGKRGGKDWIMIGDGKTGHSGPLPKSEADALALLRKFGGS